MRILGFLQNAVLDGDEDDKRNKLYKYNSIFRMVCFDNYNNVGKRISKAFGDELYNGIVLDNATDKHVDSFKTLKYDVEHIKKVIDCVKPNIIICFGKIAEDGIIETLHKYDKKLNCKTVILFTNHPTARSPKETLKRFAVRLKNMVEMLKEDYGKPERVHYINYKIVK